MIDVRVDVDVGVHWWGHEIIPEGLCVCPAIVHPDVPLKALCTNGSIPIFVELQQLRHLDRTTQLHKRASSIIASPSHKIHAANIGSLGFIKKFDACDNIEGGGLLVQRHNLLGEETQIIEGAVDI